MTAPRPLMRSAPKTSAEITLVRIPGIVDTDNPRQSPVHFRAVAAHIRQRFSEAIPRNEYAAHLAHSLLMDAEALDRIAAEREAAAANPTPEGADQ